MGVRLVNAETPVEVVLGRGTVPEDELPDLLDDVRFVQWGHRPYQTPLFWAAGPDCPHGNEDPDHEEHIGHSWPNGEVLCLLRPACTGCSECESENCDFDDRRSWLADDITALWWLVSDATDTPINDGNALTATAH
jgi:hypothetical protein